MQHNVTDTVLSAFARMRTGKRWQSPLGLTVCELIDEFRAPVAWPSPSAQPVPLMWRELDPPDPRRLRAHNHGPTGVVVEAGTVVDGGMGARALPSCAVVPVRSEAIIAVEPLGGRWWNEGPLHRCGRLEPVATALLLQAALASQPLASSALTAFRSLPRAALLMDDDAAPSTAAGWLLEDDDGIVGGWIIDHAPAARPRPQVAWHADLCAPDAAPLRLLLALQEDVEYGALDVHMIEHGAAGRDMVLLPRGVCLADRAKNAA